MNLHADTISFDCGTRQETDGSLTVVRRLIRRREPSLAVTGAQVFRWLLFVVILSITGVPVAHGACSKIDHDHAAWSAILNRYVSDGRVDYRGMKQSGESQLNAYLTTLSGACASDYTRWTRKQRLAYWINAYNAFTVRLILDNYPISSIRKIGWLPGAAFRREFIPMEGLKGGRISLDDIEHKTLRADFVEPRIHFALVCAARSCPPLRNEAYRAVALDRQLDEQGRAFLRNPALNRFDAAGRALYLSSIFTWFRGDFEAAAGSLPAFVSPYLGDTRVTEPGVRIEFLDYDWSLNE